MSEKNETREISAESLLLACERATAFLCQKAGLNINISVASQSDMNCANRWADYFNWKGNFIFEENLSSRFFLKLEHEDTLVALCEGFVHGKDSDGNETVTIDAFEKDRKNELAALKGLVIPFFVEACRQIAEIENLETVFCACIDPKPADKTLPIYHDLGFTTEFNPQNGGYAAIRDTNKTINWSAFQM